MIEILTENDEDDFTKSIQCVMKSTLENNPAIYEQYDFDNILKECVYENFIEFVDYESYSTIYDDSFDDNMHECMLPYRSMLVTFDSYYDMSEKINELVNIPQPEQRTNEWYIFRQDHITASNAWKCLGNEKTINSIIYEKLKPLNIEKYKPSFNDSPLTWGQKFEPISVMLYEREYGTHVLDLGCLEHPKYSFLAASPDGLVDGANRNGRLLEIKNVVSREITKIPKLDYWIQMQLQMEVCDLDDCDFLETKFIEFDSFSEFAASDKETKGIISVYIKDGERPVYEYSDINSSSEEEFNIYLEKVSEKYEGDETMIWVKNIYWYLDTFSCIFVPRNKLWFEYAIPKIQKVWEVIIEERKKLEGPNLEKYAPQKRQPKGQDQIKVVKKSLIKIDNMTHGQDESSSQKTESEPCVDSKFIYL
jgi:putative phage-type endonuclease